MSGMSKFEVVRGVEGCCLLLDDLRIAGPKPWGGGSVIHTWETDKKYKAIVTCTMQPTFINPVLKDGGYYQEYECSNCSEYTEITNYYGENSRPNYCVHCGAKVIWDD